MAVFKYKNNVPDVYPNESRDFQLICNVFDLTQNSIKYDIDSMLNILDTNLCPEKLLPLLQTKLGFISNYNLSAKQLRIVLKAFPYLIKNKGSTKGIQQTIQTFLKTQNIFGNVQIDYENKGTSLTYHDGRTVYLENIYEVNIGLQTKLLDVSLLTELLKFIIPAGYILRYYFYKPMNWETIVNERDTINILFVSEDISGSIRDDSMTDKTSISAVSTTTIPSSSQENSDILEDEVIINE